MNKGVIYYTDNRIGEPIRSLAIATIVGSGLPVVSCSLAPIWVGQNTVLDLQPGAITLFKQILAALEHSTAGVVFFSEHDTLYHPSHFEFDPPRDDTYYYNTHVWRWDYPCDRAVTYDNLAQLSGLCAYRDLLLAHYRARLDYIQAKELDDSRDPNWARKMGYEPGKARRRGGFKDEPVAFWRSPYPNIDIRHNGTHTPRKVKLSSFKHPPTGWREGQMVDVEGWDLQEIFEQCPNCW